MIVAAIPATISGARSRLDSASAVMPATISAAAAIAAWRAAAGAAGARTARA